MVFQCSHLDLVFPLFSTASEKPLKELSKEVPKLDLLLGIRFNNIHPVHLHRIHLLMNLYHLYLHVKLIHEVASVLLI